MFCSLKHSAFPVSFLNSPRIWWCCVKSSHRSTVSDERQQESYPAALGWEAGRVVWGSLLSTLFFFFPLRYPPQWLSRNAVKEHFSLKLRKGKPNSRLRMLKYCWNSPSLVCFWSLFIMYKAKGLWRTKFIFCAKSVKIHAVFFF